MKVLLCCLSFLLFKTGAEWCCHNKNYSRTYSYLHNTCSMYLLLFHQLKWVKAHRMWTYQRRKLSEAHFLLACCTVARSFSSNGAVLVANKFLTLFTSCCSCLVPWGTQMIILLVYLTLKENQQKQFKESIKRLFKAKYCSYHHTFLF